MFISSTTIPVDSRRDVATSPKNALFLSVTSYNFLNFNDKIDNEYYGSLLN